MRLKLAAAAAVVLVTGVATAAPPQVATDIPPVHALVARVMQGVGTPTLVLPPGASPHTHAMRPSEARALADAELVFWMGAALTPWLERAIDSLGHDAVSVALLEVPGTTLLSVRDGSAAGTTGDGRDGAAAHREAHEGAHGHAHGESERGQAEGGTLHGNAHDGTAHGHVHVAGAVDPHAWLDPLNARLWLEVIAGHLAAADPENAGNYRRNAAAAQAEIDTLVDELSARLAPVRDLPFVVYHDAYRYFEERFGIDSAGAISPGDATGPGAGRVSGIRDVVRRTGAACVFAEPQFAESLVRTVTEGTGARAAVLDPVGAALASGPELYPRLLRNLAAGMVACLDPGA